MICPDEAHRIAMPVPRFVFGALLLLSFLVSELGGQSLSHNWFLSGQQVQQVSGAHQKYEPVPKGQVPTKLLQCSSCVVWKRSESFALAKALPEIPPEDRA